MQGTKRPLEDEDADDCDELEVPNEDHSTYCRLCFSITQLEPIFEHRKDANEALTGLIEICTAIRLKVKTDFPCSICIQCHNKLKEFRRFRNLCQSFNRVVNRTKRDKIIPAHLESWSAQEAAASTSATVEDAFWIQELSEDELDLTGTVSLNQQEQQTEQFIAPSAEDAENDLPYIKLSNDYFCCKLCNKIFQKLNILMDHFRNQHREMVQVYSYTGDPSDPNDPSTVDYSLRELAINEVLVGTSVFFKCDSCDTLFTQKRNIARHRWRYHSNYTDTANATKIYCEEEGCGCFFMDAKAYRRHMQALHGKMRRNSKVIPIEAMQYEDTWLTADAQDAV